MLKRPRQRTWSIQAHFLLYSLALFVPTLIFSGLMILRSASLERQTMEFETTDVVSTVAIAIDRELAAVTTTLKALASSPSLAEGDLKAFHGQAMAAQEVGGDHFFLTSADGQATRQYAGALGQSLARRLSQRLEASRRDRQAGSLEYLSGHHGESAGFSVSVPVQKRKKIRVCPQRLGIADAHP